MNTGKMIQIANKYDFITYFGNWKTTMQMMHQVLSRKDPIKAKRYQIISIPAPIESLSFNNDDLSILLMHLDNNLEIFEKTQIISSQFPYRSYAETRLFLKTFFIFFRILLDDLAGIIEYFYKTNEKLNLPKSFNDLQKKAKKSGHIPEDIIKVLEPTYLWFPMVKDTRENLVHYYDSLLLSFQQENIGENTIGYFNTKGLNHIKEEDTRRNVGFLLCKYHEFLDNLLDHFDKKFYQWYGFTQGKSSRTLCITQGYASLYWAYKYGGYKNETLQVIE